MKNVEQLLAQAAELAGDGRHFQAERAYKGVIRLLAKTEPTSERLAEACLQLERVYNELAGKIESRRNDYLDAANAAYQRAMAVRESKNVTSSAACSLGGA